MKKQKKRGVKKGMTAEKQALRNIKIRRLRAKGWSASEIAQVVDLTPQGVREVLTRVAGERKKEIAEEADRLMVEIADGFAEDIREATEIIAMIPKKLAGFKVGALRARIDARDKHVKTLQSLGFVHQAPERHLVGELTHAEALRLLQDGQGSTEAATEIVTGEKKEK